MSDPNTAISEIICIIKFFYQEARKITTYLTLFVNDCCKLVYKCRFQEERDVAPW